MDGFDIDKSYDSIAQFYKEQVAYIEKKEQERLQEAIYEAKGFLKRYSLKPKEYGECRFNRTMKHREGVYYEGDYRKPNFILVKIFSGKIYCWFDAMIVMQAICRNECHVLTEEELNMVLWFVESLTIWMKEIESLHYFFAPARISIIKRKIKELFYTKSGKLKRDISSSAIIVVLYEMLKFKCLNKKYNVI